MNYLSPNWWVYRISGCHQPYELGNQAWGFSPPQGFWHFQCSCNTFEEGTGMAEAGARVRRGWGVNVVCWSFRMWSFVGWWFSNPYHPCMVYFPTFCHRNEPNVGNYTSPMHPMGIGCFNFNQWLRQPIQKLLVMMCFCVFVRIFSRYGSSEYERISCYIFDLEHQGYAVFVLVKDQEPEWVLAEWQFCWLFFPNDMIQPVLILL